MTTALYRINGGEVIKISGTDQTWPDRNTTYWGVLTDPPFPDGTVVREPDGPLRVLGFAKINDAGTVRNATQPEIDTFAPAQTADENLQDAGGAEDLFLNHPRFRKLMTAYSDIIKDELNILRGWIADYKTEVAAATSLGDLQTRVAGLPDLPDRTLVQLKTAIQNRISEND
jgi:hypothetical protein